MILLDSKVLWHLHQYWDAKRGQSAVLAKQSIDPVELRDILPHLFMIEANGTPPRFRIRLVGTGVTRLIGRDSTGRYVDEVVGEEKRQAAIAPYSAVITEGRPIAKRGPLVWLDSRNWIETEVLLLPVTRSGTGVDFILGATVEVGRRAHLQPVDASRSVEYDHVPWGPEFTFTPNATAHQSFVRQAV